MPPGLFRTVQAIIPGRELASPIIVRATDQSGPGAIDRGQTGASAGNRLPAAGTNNSQINQGRRNLSGAAANNNLPSAAQKMSLLTRTGMFYRPGISGWEQHDNKTGEWTGKAKQIGGTSPKKPAAAEPRKDLNEAQNARAKGASAQARAQAPTSSKPVIIPPVQSVRPNDRPPSRPPQTISEQRQPSRQGQSMNSQRPPSRPPQEAQPGAIHARHPLVVHPPVVPGVSSLIHTSVCFNAASIRFSYISQKDCT